MTRRVLSYVRHHHIALLALFVALGGTSYAATRLPRNSVGTKQIKKNAVTTRKVKDSSLLLKDFAAGQLPPNFIGAGAGGDLTGTYPNPELGEGSVNSAKVANRSLTGLDFARAGGTIALDFGIILAHSCATAGLGANGAARSDVVLVNAPAVGKTGAPPPAYPGGLVINGRSQTDLIEIQVCNVTAASINPPDADYPYLILRPS
jgi:hypothetical protein